jgi:alpha-tubulin suppressor-like RCC1 family protein
MFRGCNVCDAFLSEADLMNRFVGQELWTWGRNNFTLDTYSGWGVLGDGTVISRSSPVQTISGGTNWNKIFVSDSGFHTAGIKTDGTLWLWGRGGYGQLGNNSSICRSSPVQTISGGTNWRLASLGGAHSGAIKTDGTLWLWGQGCRGILGNNVTTNVLSPVQTISGGTDWRLVSLGRAHSGAIKTDGTLWLWGNNYRGQLGILTTTDRSSPVQTISGGTDWNRISLGFDRSASIKKNGSLWIWGWGFSGSLGNNSTINRSSPVQTTSGGTNWKQHSLGCPTVAIKTDGTFWQWGSLSGGTTGVSTPTQLGSETNWRSAYAGEFTRAGIKVDGTLWLWGCNSEAQLGIGTRANYQFFTSPSQTVSGGLNWRSVNLGRLHTGATRLTGE